MEARLERSQAEAKAQRAQQRLDEFLAEQPAAQVPLVPDHLHLVSASSCAFPWPVLKGDLQHIC